MSNEKFTPGKWEVPAGSKIVRIGGIVLEMVADCDIKYRNAEENEANANLIAAAPDMYEALKKVEQYGNDRFLSQFSNMDELVTELKFLAGKAKAALAKANPQTVSI